MPRSKPTLHQFVRSVLQERAATPEMADTSNLALAVYALGKTEKSYILFDRNQFVHFLIQEIRAWIKHHGKNLTTKAVMKKMGNHGYASAFASGMADHAEQFIIGTIEIIKPRLSNTRNNGAWEVHGPAAIGKYGPMMYDIAMADAGELMPDRTDVSPSAAKVWKYYKDNRQDVIATPLDDIDDPITPEKRDDGRVYSHGKENFGNFLDSTYHLSGAGPNVESLISSHKQLEGYLKSKLGITPNVSRQILMRSVDSFFNKMDSAQYR